MTFSRVRKHVIPADDEFHPRYRWISHFYFWTLLVAGILEMVGVSLMWSGDRSTFSAAQKVHIVGLAIQFLFNLELAFVMYRAWRRMEALDRFDRPMSRVKALLAVVLAVLGLLQVSWP
jgi:hypothetical protein